MPESVQVARERARRWYADNRERAVAAARERYKKNKKDPEWVKRNNERLKLRARDLRRRVIEGYGGECVCCLERQYEFLVLDHVNGGGRKHREKFKGNYCAYWVYFIEQDFPDDYRVLCCNCNAALAHYAQCPHARMIHA